MISGGTPRQKNSPRPSPALSPTKKGQTTTSSRRFSSCCGGSRDCTVAGATVSRHQQPATKMEEQVGELEKEVQKQKELRAMYRMRMERSQDYIRHCLQIAQDNGFLDLIISNKNPNNNSLINLSSPSTPNNNNNNSLINLSSSSTPNNNIPRTPPAPVNQYQSHLPALIDQAKNNGWYVQPHEIELHEKIAQGSTADIYKATWRGIQVAVKCMYPDFFLSNPNGLSFFAQELQTLSMQRHRFVLQLMGACLEPPDHGWVVTEFLPTTLKDWLHGPGSRQRERTIPLRPRGERLSKAVEISQAMQYLHGHRPMVLHRDLKPSNIFLDDGMHVRVADFGHARFLTDGEKALTGEIGTYVYMAPEVIRGEPYDEKCDVYSFGIILNELITGEYPYTETEFGPSRIAMEVAEGRIRPALANGREEEEEEVNELIKATWEEDAALRPSFAYITCTLTTILNRFLHH